MSEARKNLKWIAVGFGGLLVAAVAVLLLFAHQGDTRLEEKLAELRAAGEPMKLADLEPRPVAPADDAAFFLRRAQRGVDQIIRQLADVEHHLSVAQEEAFTAMRSIDGAQDLLRSALDAHKDVFPLLEQASRCPEFDPGINYRISTADVIDSLYERAIDMQSISQVLCYQAMLQLEDGQREEAMQTCLVLVRLSRFFDRYPLQLGRMVSLIGYGIGVNATNRVVRSGPLLETTHAELERELARNEVAANSRQSLRSERALVLHEFGEAGLSSVTEVLDRVGPWSAKQGLCDYLDLMAVAIATPLLPNDEWQRAFDAAGGAECILSTSETPPGTFHEGHDATLIAIALLRALRVLNAIYAHGLSESELIPTAETLGLPPDVMTDPFNDKPLIIKRLPEGWLIYSVGANLKDDGGGATQLENNADVGIGPPPVTKARGATPKEKEGANDEAPTP